MKNGMNNVLFDIEELTKVEPVRSEIFELNSNKPTNNVTPEINEPNDVDPTNTIKKSRQIKKNESGWKKNFRNSEKRLRNSDEEYTSTKGKTVEKETIGR